MDQETRKVMTIHKELHPRGNVDRLYVSRRECGRGLACIEDSVDESNNDSKTTQKRAEDNWWKPPETILTTRGSVEHQ